LLNNRLSFDADYFIRDTKNAIISVNIPAIGGTVLKNVGVIRNSGIELSISIVYNLITKANILSIFIGYNYFKKRAV